MHTSYNMNTNELLLALLSAFVSHITVSIKGHTVLCNWVAGTRYNVMSCYFLVLITTGLLTDQCYFYFLIKSEPHTL